MANIGQPREVVIAVPEIPRLPAGVPAPPIQVPVKEPSYQPQKQS